MFGDQGFDIPDVSRAHLGYGGRDVQAPNITFVNGNVDPVAMPSIANHAPPVATDGTHTQSQHTHTHSPSSRTPPPTQWHALGIINGSAPFFDSCVQGESCPKQSIQARPHNAQCRRRHRHHASSSRRPRTRSCSSTAPPTVGTCTPQEPWTNTTSPTPRG